MENLVESSSFLGPTDCDVNPQPPQQNVIPIDCQKTLPSLQNIGTIDNHMKLQPTNNDKTTQQDISPANDDIKLQQGQHVDDLIVPIPQSTLKEVSLFEKIKLVCKLLPNEPSLRPILIDSEKLYQSWINMPMLLSEDEFRVAVCLLDQDKEVDESITGLHFRYTTVQQETPLYESYMNQAGQQRFRCKLNIEIAKSKNNGLTVAIIAELIFQRPLSACHVKVNTQFGCIDVLLPSQTKSENIVLTVESTGTGIRIHLHPHVPIILLDRYNQNIELILEDLIEADILHNALYSKQQHSTVCLIRGGRQLMLNDPVVWRCKDKYYLSWQNMFKELVGPELTDVEMEQFQSLEPNFIEPKLL